jgi:hypothetical protein
MPAPSRLDAGTASQLIRGVLRTGVAMRRGSTEAQLTLVVLLACSIACKTPGYRAPHLTREGVAALALGISEREVVHALGNPPFRVADNDLAFLSYASPPEWKVASTHLVRGTDLSFAIVLSGDQLTSATIVDSRASVACICDTKACPTGWAKTCLDLFPSASSGGNAETRLPQS